MLDTASLCERNDVCLIGLLVRRRSLVGQGSMNRGSDIRRKLRFRVGRLNLPFARVLALPLQSQLAFA